MTNSSKPWQLNFLTTPSELWSGDLGLTLLSITFVLQIFVVTPLREAALGGRIFFDLIILALMICGALVAERNRIMSVLIIAILLFSGVVLTAARLYPVRPLQAIGSGLVTLTLFLYIRIVLLIIFRAGPVAWNRIHGGVCVYLLVGMAWASQYEFLETLAPGSFRFSSHPADIDQLTSRLTYFSFGTLTTVGSDIIPLTPAARYMCIAEAVVGQLFPAILIGALVAMAMQPKSSSSGEH